MNKQHNPSTNHAANEIAQTFTISIEGGDTIVAEITGTVNDVASNVKQAELIIDHIKNIFANIEEQKFNLLVMLNQLGGGAHYPSPQARKLYASIIDDPHVDKIALVAPNALLRSIMRFVIYATARDKQGSIRFFDNAGAARDWLHDNKRNSEKIIVRPR